MGPSLAPRSMIANGLFDDKRKIPTGPIALSIPARRDSSSSISKETSPIDLVHDVPKASSERNNSREPQARTSRRSSDHKLNIDTTVRKSLSTDPTPSPVESRRRTVSGVSPTTSSLGSIPKPTRHPLPAKPMGFSEIQVKNQQSLSSSSSREARRSSLSSRRESQTITKSISRRDARDDREFDHGRSQTDSPIEERDSASRKSSTSETASVTTPMPSRSSVATTNGVHAAGVVNKADIPKASASTGSPAYSTSASNTEKPLVSSMIIVDSDFPTVVTTSNQRTLAGAVSSSSGAITTASAPSASLKKVPPLILDLTSPSAVLSPTLPQPNLAPFAVSSSTDTPVTLSQLTSPKDLLIRGDPASTSQAPPPSPLSTLPSESSLPSESLVDGQSFASTSTSISPISSSVVTSSSQKLTASLPSLPVGKKIAETSAPLPQLPTEMNVDITPLSSPSPSTSTRQSQLTLPTPPPTGDGKGRPPSANSHNPQPRSSSHNQAASSKANASSDVLVVTSSRASISKGIVAESSPSLVALTKSKKKPTRTTSTSRSKPPSVVIPAAVPPVATPTAKSLKRKAPSPDESPLTPVGPPSAKRRKAQQVNVKGASSVAASSSTPTPLPKIILRYQPSLHVDSTSSRIGTGVPSTSSPLAISKPRTAPPTPLATPTRTTSSGLPGNTGSSSPSVLQTATPARARPPSSTASTTTTRPFIRPPERKKRKVPMKWPVNAGMYSTKLQPHKPGLGNPSVRKVVYNEDGSQIALCCSDKTVRIWHNRSKVETARLSHNSDLLDIAWLHGGSGLLLLDENGTVSRWTQGDKSKWEWNQLLKVPSEDLEATKTPGDFPCFAYHRNTIAVSLPALGIRIYALESGSWALKRYVAKPRVSVMRFIRDGALLIGGTMEGTVWSLVVKNTGVCRAISNMQKQMKFFSRWLLGEAHMLPLAQTEAGNGPTKSYIIPSAPQTSTKSGFGACFAANAQAVIYGNVAGCGLVWDTKKCAVVYALEHDEDDEITTLAVFKGQIKGGDMVTGTKNGELVWWLQPVSSSPSNEPPPPPPKKRAKLA
ncbi:hypothetical protein DL96DRAFT_1614769 [Flagelloscypha sp. PMI_526]|nr:hypothetical protein DL96DRAFT_1614769 [Flagelloscypha sp. PMI_526]